MAANDRFREERSTLIDAAPEAIFPQVDDFRRWVDWSPYEKMDAALQKTYSGAARGKGKHAHDCKDPYSPAFHGPPSLLASVDYARRYILG